MSRPRPLAEPASAGVVVIVDHDPEQLARITESLRRRGWNAHGFATATGARLYVEVARPAVVLVGGDAAGIELALYVRADPIMRSIPIVASGAVAAALAEALFDGRVARRDDAGAIEEALARAIDARRSSGPGSLRRSRA